MKAVSGEQALLRLIQRRLAEGASIEIRGMGSFECDSAGKLVFRPCDEPLVFLAYAHEDRAKAKRLFRQLQNAGLSPWMDCQKLLAGQNWPRAIHQTVEVADFFIACFSKRSASKRGHFQSELAQAMEEARRFPEDRVFIVPVRLDDCDIPPSLRSTQYIDLFPDWTRGVRKLIAALWKQHAGGR